MRVLLRRKVMALDPPWWGARRGVVVVPLIECGPSLTYWTDRACLEAEMKVDEETVRNQEQECCCGMSAEGKCCQRSDGDVKHLRGH